MWKAIYSIGLACFLAVLGRNTDLAEPGRTLAFPKPNHSSAISINKNEGISVGTVSPGTGPLYLPLIFAPDPFLKDIPIWPHTGSPASHEIALFRHTFKLTDRLSEARISIFADTRYQVWLDGVFINRGPARFSTTLREYDVLKLGDLLPGSHTISVLVQWAPNYRRSESLSPFLQAHIEGYAHGRYSKVAPTGPEWHSMLSDAWRQDSAPVHSWGLIGPTELMDLRKLPQNWMRADFEETGWKAAEPVNPYDGAIDTTVNPQYIYRPRSIDLLVQSNVTPVLIDAGFLSPGFMVNEITPPFKEPVDLQFTSTITSGLTIETLISSETTTDTIQLDGKTLSWQPAGQNRPDVISTSTVIAPGDHKLNFVNLPPTGLTFNVSTSNIKYGNLLFGQGINAGRRLLLSEPVTNPAAAFPLPGPGLNLEVTSPPAYFVLDLGRTVHGRIQARVKGPEGTIIDVGWDERLYPGTKRPMPYPGRAHPQWNQVDSWILDGSKRFITTIDTRAGRYILFAIWGNGPVRLEEVIVREERYPFDIRGSFQSTDPLLNRIWQVGADTLAPNRTDAYTDTPWRERGQWWGDAYVASQIDRVVSGDYTLMKRGLALMADEFKHTSAPGYAPNGNGTHMLDYAMLWVLDLYEYYRLTGDSDFIYQTYPSVKKFLDHLESLENTSTGLIDLPQEDWSTTAYIESLGFESRFGQSTAVNALYYQTLLQAASLAEISGDAGSGKKWREKADAVRGSTNDLLYNSGERTYATTYYQGKYYPPTPQALTWALAYGLPPEENIEPLIASLESILSRDPSQPNLDIYGMYWLLESLGRSGHIDEALSIIKSYYGRLLDKGATTWWENFKADQNWATSYSHAWGGSPTWFLSTYVLGARMTGPNEWVAAPALEGVLSASGSIPVGDNVLTVTWEHRACSEASIAITSGSTTTGEIVVPLMHPLVKLAVNGTVVWESGKSNSPNIFTGPDGLHIQVSGGNYSLFAFYDCEN